VVMVHVNLARIGALVSKIVALVAMANARAGIVRIVAPALVIVALVLQSVEMAPVKMERIGVIVFKIVALVEMVHVKVSMVRIVALVPKIAAPVVPITLVLVEIH
jgi:hypothetical protein